ncbi:MAG TPA: phosphatase PAP2 family protein [Chitinophagaceae bacterium]|nr:phosphatase PAP2 family protein [Chitinophagaceae bacterium]
MKKIFAFMIAVAAWMAGNGQTDTSRKAQDSLVTVSLTDTLELHTDSFQVSKPERKGSVYKIKPAIDLPIIAAGTAWSLYGFSQIYNKPSSPEARILSLRKSDINGFDRAAADNYDEGADKTSDALFYGSMPVPVLFMLLDGKVRKDFGKVFLVWWETMAVTGIYYTGSAHLIDRYRPLAYNSAAPMHERTSGNAKNSFIGGHPALVGSMTFFVAKVYSDYHPDSKAKWVFYTAATAATVTTAYLRYKAGKHFPSDLVAGSILGPLTGILVPHFHKNKQFKDANLSIRPYSGASHGLILTYRFK